MIDSLIMINSWFPPPDIKIRIIVFWLREMCSCTYCANASIVPSIFSPLPGSRQSCWLERQNGEQEHALLCLRMQHGRLQQVEEVMLKWGAVLLRQRNGVRLPSAASRVTSSHRYTQRGAPQSHLPPLCEMCVQKKPSRFFLWRTRGFLSRYCETRAYPPSAGRMKNRLLLIFPAYEPQLLFLASASWTDSQETIWSWWGLISKLDWLVGT